ncbi:MAG: ATP-binding protein [Pseudobdellovibrionaceae bacterium]|nr:ATP-binding protein [Pseudobdellovibrionaceae bacterium]
MEHIEMGICTVSGLDIRINKDYSRHLETLLTETQLYGKSFMDMLKSRSLSTSDEIDQARQALIASLNESRFAFEANSHLLPRKLMGVDRDQKPYSFDLEWIPICDDELNVERILVTMNDVTTLRSLEAIAAQKDVELQIISEILNHTEREWSGFVENSKRLLGKSVELCNSLHDSAEPLVALRNIFIHVHTLKGNARSLGLRQLNDVIHSSEQLFAVCLRSQNTFFEVESVRLKLENIIGMLQKYTDIATEKLRRAGNQEETIGVPRETLMQIFSQLRRHEQGSECNHSKPPSSVALMRQFLYRPVDQFIKQLFGEIEPIAVQLGKTAPSLFLELPDLWLNRPMEGLLRNCLVHLLRNCLDHGLQTPAERQHKGLDPRGTIHLGARQRGHMMEFVLSDDGRGLNLAKLREIGLQRGLIDDISAGDPNAVAALIFHPDLSTSEGVTDISGRGIGMTAVKDSIHSMDGSIDIVLQSSRHVDKGFSAFSFIIALPLDLFEFDSAQEAA